MTDPLAIPVSSTVYFIDAMANIVRDSRLATAMERRDLLVSAGFEDETVILLLPAVERALAQPNYLRSV